MKVLIIILGTLLVIACHWLGAYIERRRMRRRESHANRSFKTPT